MPPAKKADPSISDVDGSTGETETNSVHSDIPEGNKRPVSSSDSNESTPAKKVRNKPQPQIIKNMKEYVDNNTLDRLTTTTLRHWLKERSLPCTTREKKENLIQKVRTHFLESAS